MRTENRIVTKGRVTNIENLSVKFNTKDMRLHFISFFSIGVLVYASSNVTAQTPSKSLDTTGKRIAQRYDTQHFTSRRQA
jgi:hypothetical protein